MAGSPVCKGRLCWPRHWMLGDASLCALRAGEGRDGSWPNAAVPCLQGEKILGRGIRGIGWSECADGPHGERGHCAERFGQAEDRHGLLGAPGVAPRGGSGRCRMPWPAADGRAEGTLCLRGGTLRCKRKATYVRHRRVGEVQSAKRACRLWKPFVGMAVCGGRCNARWAWTSQGGVGWPHRALASTYGPATAGTEDEVRGQRSEGMVRAKKCRRRKSEGLARHVVSPQPWRGCVVTQRIACARGATVDGRSMDGPRCVVVVVVCPSCSMCVAVPAAHRGGRCLGRA